MKKLILTVTMILMLAAGTVSAGDYAIETCTLTFTGVTAAATAPASATGRCGGNGSGFPMDISGADSIQIEFVGASAASWDLNFYTSDTKAGTYKLFWSASDSFTLTTGTSKSVGMDVGALWLKVTMDEDASDTGSATVVITVRK